MKRVLLLAMLCALTMEARAATYYVIVAGLGGEADYEQRFTAAAKDLDRIFKAAGGTAHVYTLAGPQATAAQLRQTMDAVARDAQAEDDFALIIIGHGSFDGVEYKLNLVGPDVTAAEIGALCDRIGARRQLVVNTTSASGGAVQALERPARAVIAATKSGMEKNATVFARYWIEALRDPASDSDKNEAISALEAFKYSEQKTAKFFETQNRLATEHALLEDTGKGEGTKSPSPENGEGLLAGQFTVLHLGAVTAQINNPEKLALLKRKEELEQSIDDLKYHKASMDLGEYRAKLQQYFLELAKTQEALDK